MVISSAGIIFDVIRGMIQRSFGYATDDVRYAYAHVKESLMNVKYEKVVLILHSQGGISGSLIVDWLLDEIPQDFLQKLEVYTFANAANHFNNPYRSARELQWTLHKRQLSRPLNKCIRYIEHYANSRDYVSVCGVLNYIQLPPNRFMGRIFVREGSGHLLTQHYLDTMFPIGPDGQALEINDFMDSEVRFKEESTSKLSRHDEPRETLLYSLESTNGVLDGNILTDTDNPSSPVTVVPTSPDDPLAYPLKVKDLSRLWQYRNGRSPRS
jgi:hypothetical protein